ILHPYVGIRNGGEINSLHFSTTTNVPMRNNASADGSFTLGLTAAPGDELSEAAVLAEGALPAEAAPSADVVRPGRVDASGRRGAPRGGA
ncbi:MAG TPA: hypothetical protein VFS00_03325, partial [Polyangiaceae bacterium]|nr:hypothetical protein [Polyangiaceae bacterium]